MAAERELPPLHVKLTGDASSYTAMMELAVKKVKELEKAISDKRAFETALKEEAKSFKRHWNRMVATARDGYQNMGRLTPAFNKTKADLQKQQKEAEKSARANKNNLDNLVKNAETNKVKTEKEQKQRTDRNLKEQQGLTKRFYFSKTAQLKKSQEEEFRLTSTFEKTASKISKEKQAEYKKNANALDNLVKNAETNRAKAAKEKEAEQERIRKLNETERSAFKEKQKQHIADYKAGNITKQRFLELRREAIEKTSWYKEARANEARLAKEAEAAQKKIQKAQEETRRKAEAQQKKDTKKREQEQERIRKLYETANQKFRRITKQLDADYKAGNISLPVYLQKLKEAREELPWIKQKRKEQERIRKLNETERSAFKEKQKQHIADYKAGNITKQRFLELRKEAREKTSWYKEARANEARLAKEKEAQQKKDTKKREQEQERIRKLNETERSAFKEKQKQHIADYKAGNISKQRFLELRREAIEKTSWYKEARKNEARLAKEAEAAQKKIQKAQEETRRKAEAAAKKARTANRFGRGSMGDRADVYMHAGALRGMAQGVGNFLKPGMELETLTAQMSIFTRSANDASDGMIRAKELVKEFQELAIQTPYSTNQLAESAVLMMRYGVKADDVKGRLQGLGDIAGGNAHKLHLLSLALGQTMSIGKLTGGELRQMAEHGFNPLKVIAKETATDKSDAGLQKRYEELVALMRKGKVSAQDVANAMAIATAKGGDYAGMQNKMSKTVEGLTQQVYENIEALKNEVYEQFIEEIKTALYQVLGIMKAVREWAKANKETIKTYGMFVIEILAAAAAFHMLGYVFARIMWIMGTGGKLIGVLVGAITILGRIFGSLISILGLTRIGFIATWIAALGPIAWVITGITLLIAAIGSIGLSLWYPGGFVAAFYDATQAVIGFFWNLSENVTKIMEWSARNWKALIIDVLLALTGVGGLINAAVAYGSGKSIGEHMAGTYDEMGLNLQGPDLSKAMEAIKLPSLPEPIKPEELPIPEKPKVDYGHLMGPAEADVEVAKRAKDAVMAGSAEHAVQQWEAMQQVQADTAKEKLPQTKQEKQGEDMVKLLRGIEQNTKPSTKFDETLTSAGLGELA